MLLRLLSRTYPSFVNVLVFLVVFFFNVTQLALTPSVSSVSFTELLMCSFFGTREILLV